MGKTKSYNKPRSTRKIQISEMPLPVARSARSKACAEALSKWSLKSANRIFSEWIFPLHFCKNSDLAFTTWHHVFPCEKQSELRNGMAGIRVVLQNCVNDVCFQICLRVTFWKNPPKHRHFTPSNHLFQKPLGSYFVRFLATQVPVLRLTQY